MSKFIRYEDKYINLDFVSRVEMKKGMDSKYYIEMYLSDAAYSTLRIVIENEAKAKATFDEIGVVLGSQNFISSIS